MARAEREFVCITCNKKFLSRNWKPGLPDPKWCSIECRYPKKIRTCPVCGKQDEVSATNKKVSICCSVQCGNIWKNRNNGTELVCDSCGKKFHKPNSQLKTKNYCSEECRLKSFEEKWITKICPVCGKEFETRISREATYCSNDCNLRSEERKLNNKRLYTGVSLLDRGYSQEQYNTFISDTIERNKERGGYLWEELYGEEKAKELKKEITKKYSGAGNPMSYESLMERMNIDSIKEARELMPGTGRFGELHPFYGKHHSVESKKQMIETMETKGMFGRSANGLFDGLAFQGTWELKYIIDCKENNIPIKRFDLEPIYYELEGKPHHYFPDFIINEINVIEIKGMFWNKFQINKKKEAAEKIYKYSLITDVGQNQAPKTFLRLMKAKYGERLVLKNNPYKEVE